MKKKKVHKPFPWNPCKYCGRLAPTPFCSSACSRAYSGNMETCERFNIRCPFSLLWGSGDKCTAIGEECERWRKNNNITLSKPKPKIEDKPKQPEGLDKWQKE